MCSQNSLKKIIIFSAAFLIGIFSVVTYRGLNSNAGIQNLSADKKFQRSESVSDERESCLNFCRACKCEIDFTDEKSKVLESVNPADSKPLKVIYKPEPKYTEKAKRNKIEGHVRVRVVFLANGKIGSVSEISGLPFGLTEKAFEAAKQMKFEPEIKNGNPVSVSKAVHFSFETY